VQPRAALEQELVSHNNGGAARRRARDVHRRICDNDGGDQPPLFAWASQNIVAMTILLRSMPKPSTPEGRQAHEELRFLLERAMV
jgi:hypothetical protein